MPTPHKVETTKKAPQTPGKSASVHLEGFADAAPSPMTASTKPLETTTTTAAAPSTSPKKSRAKSATGANNAESPVQKAREASNSLIQSALLSTLETSYTQLQQERDAIQTQLSTSLSTISSLKLENNALKSAQEESSKSVEETMKRLREECAQERNRREEMEKKLKFSEERVDRLEGEGDSLRGEISRLKHTNDQHTNLITQIQTQNSFSTSQVIPLQLQLTRLQQELDAATCHSNHIEAELAARNASLAEARNEHAKEIRSLRGDADERKYELERRDRDLASTRRHLELAQAELERMRNTLHEKECQFIEQREMIEKDLNKERELVSLKDQAMQLAREQRDTVAQELRDIQAMAVEAAEREGRMEREMQLRLKDEVDKAVRLIKEEEQGKRNVIADRLREAQEAKRQLEEDILSKETPMKRRARMIECGNAPLAINDGQDGGPMSLTDLYSRLAETEDQLRAEQHENKKLKILIDRIHRDVASKTPLFHQKQIELESVLEELEESRERLDYARREVVDIRSDNQYLEAKNQQMERECREMSRENTDLALQVQRLLQRGMVERGEDNVTFDSIQSLHDQNQKLLRDHHSMSEKIQTLEDHINNNPEKIELDELKEEVVTLREEREKQSKLVAGIVHQRDLYRALVAKNDAALVDNDAGNQLVLADVRAEQLPMLEMKNRELIEESAKLRADLSSLKYEKEALEGRLARLDAHANELSASNERMRGELTAASGTAARMEVDVSHYRGRCERLEASLDAIKEEKESEAGRRSRMEDLNSKLQSHLDGARSELAKKQQQFESAASKMKMLEVQLENAKASESRIAAEANELRAEIARQDALLGSVQRIEQTLVAQSEGEREQLEKEVKRLNDKMSNDEGKYSENVRKLEGKVAELELSVKDLTAQKTSAIANEAKTMIEASKMKLNVQEINLKLKTTEKELAAAKRKLGDATIDTSAEEALETKVATLASELESAKSDLEKANERIANYQNIAKSAEDQLAEVTAASTKYKGQTDAILTKLKQSEQAQREAVAELTKDLMEHRGEKDKAVNDLKAKNDSLTLQLTSAKKDASEAITRMESLNSEMRTHQLNAASATNNYERELALHAEARTALRDARSKADAEQSLRESAEASLESCKTEFETKEATWQADRTNLEKALQQSKDRLDGLQRQNQLLHEQMTSLSETVEKFQSDRTSQLVGNEDDPASVDKQLAELRELLRFKQSECVMLIADVSSAKRAAERERTAAEMAKKSLDEARSELKVLRDSTKEGESAAAGKDLEELRNKLKASDDQLVLVRESNTMLREETQRLTKKLSDVQNECKELKTAALPNNEKLSKLEVEKAALEAEKTSLSREVDAWKNRVHSLVSKFNQIDPEEHAQALASIEKLKAEAITLNSQKEKAEKDSASAKGLVARLNKEVSSQRTSIEAFKNALEKTKAEKDKLAKSSQLSEAANKKIAEAQAAAKKSEDELKAKTAEFTGEKARVDHLKKILTQMKGQLKESKDSEGKAKSNADALQKEVTELKQKLSEAPKAGEAPKQPPIPDAAPEGKSEAVKPAEPPQADKTATAAAKPVQTGAPLENLPDTAAKKKGKKRKGTPQKNVATAESKSVPPLKKPATTAETAEDQKQQQPADKESAASAASAPPHEKTVATKEATPTTSEPKPSSTETPQGGDSKEASAAAIESKPPPLEQRTPPAKRVIKLTKTSQVKKQDTAVAAKESPATSLPKKEITSEAASAACKKEEEMKRKMLLLLKKKQETTTVAPKESPAIASPKKETTTAVATAGVNEEELKRKKLLLLKKRKAQAELQVQAAAKKKLETETAAASALATLGKSLSETNDKASTDSAPPAPSSPQLKSTKPASKTTPAATSTKPLPSVPEKDESMTEEDIKKVDEKEPTPAAPAPAPLAFGSSASVSGFGIPASIPLQAEPSCPKPSFFGASSTTPTSVFGSGLSTPAFGSITKSTGLGTQSASTFGANKPEETTASSGDSTKQTSAAGGGAFLNLTPPGKAGAKPGQFVFGKSTNITLPVPAPSPFGVFNQKTQAVPFGSAFNTNPPFGSSGLVALATAAASAKPSPEKEEDKSEEGEIEESNTDEKDPVAKKA